MIGSVIYFLLGICTVHTFSALPPLGWICVWVLVLGLFTFLLPQLKLHYLFAYSLGFLWVTFQAQLHLNRQLPEELEGVSLTVVGTIASLPEIEADTARFEFDIETLGRVQLSWKELEENLTVGDQWQLRVKLKRPRTYSNPGSFDIERHFFQNRLIAKGFVLENDPKTLISSSFWNHPVDRIRTLIRDRIYESLKEREFGGLVAALVVGVKDKISVKQWTVFKETGTAHLMAISGLHVGLVSSFIFFLVRFVWSCFPSRFLFIPAPWMGALGALIGAFLYALLAGFSVPTQRSVVMVALFMFGFLTRRRICVWRSYFLALGSVLLLDPLSTLSIGFWLSFGAVGVILYGMQGRVRATGVWWKWGRAQWVTFIGLIPISLASFQQISIVSPIANSLAIPWVSFFVVPLSLVGAWLTLINQTLGGMLLRVSENLLAWIWPFLEWVRFFPRATWINAEFTIFALVTASVGILLVLTPQGFPSRWIGFIWMLPLFFSKALPVLDHEVRCTILDVGQGLSTIVETKNHVLIFDTGPKLSPNFDTGDRVVLPFLATRGWHEVDVLMISHGDNDHVGGAQSILNKIPVQEIVTSEPHLFSTLNPKVCRAGQHWNWDGVDFKILHPETQVTRKRNDHSCVLQVQAGQQSILITGDIEANSEKILLKNIKDLHSTVMLVPHHGSRTSSTLAFIQAVNPKYAIIPVGHRNAYGDPKPEIVERYKKENITVLDTIRAGAIIFTLRDEKMVLEPYRHRVETHHYWNF